MPRLRKMAVPGTRGSGGFMACSCAMNSVQRPLLAVPLLRDELAAPLPGGEDGEDGDADQQRQPRSVGQLGQVGREEQQVDREQDAAAASTIHSRPAPLVTGVVEEQQGRDRDRAGHGRAVGVGQRGRAPERQHQGEHGHQQQPVDPRDVDLAHHLFRGVLDAQSRQVAELPGLVGHGEGAADHRLRGDDGRHGGQEHHREPGPSRRQQEERVADAGRTAQDQGALAQVVQDAGGEHQQNQARRTGPRPKWPMSA